MQQLGAQPAAQGAGIAQIRCGVYNNPGAHAGKTINEIRNNFTKLWGIPTDAHAYNGKTKLEENYVVQPGDNIEFHRKAGEKG